MPDPHSSVLIGLFHIAALMSTYILARVYLKRASKLISIWSIPFFLNSIYLIYLTAFYQPKLLHKLGLTTDILDFTTSIMTASAAIHHASIILSKKKSRSKFLHFAHMQLSHLLFVLPFIFNTFSISIVLTRSLDSLFDVSFTILYTCIIIYTATFIFNAGFRDKKLPYLKDIDQV